MNNEAMRPHSSRPRPLRGLNIPDCMPTRIVIINYFSKHHKPDLLYVAWL